MLGLEKDLKLGNYSRMLRLLKNQLVIQSETTKARRCNTGINTRGRIWNTESFLQIAQLTCMVIFHLRTVWSLAPYSCVSQTSYFHFKPTLCPTHVLKITHEISWGDPKTKPSHHSLRRDTHGGNSNLLPYSSQLRSAMSTARCGTPAYTEWRWWKHNLTTNAIKSSYESSNRILVIYMTEQQQNAPSWILGNHKKYFSDVIVCSF